MSRHPPHRGQGLSQPTPKYQLIYPPNYKKAAPLPNDPYELYNWQAIEPGPSHGARSAGFGAGAAAGLGVEPGSVYGYGANGATSYGPESLQHGGSYGSNAHDKTGHKKEKGRARDSSTSQHPHHHDNGRSGGHRGHENQEEQFLLDQMLAMSLQQQDDGYPLATVVGGPHHHHGHHHHHVGSSRDQMLAMSLQHQEDQYFLAAGIGEPHYHHHGHHNHQVGSSPEHLEHPRSRARRHEYNEQSTSSFAHQGHGGRHRGRGDGSDSYLDSYKTIPSEIGAHHGGGSKSSSKTAPCGVCLEEFPVADLCKLCPGIGCGSYCVSCTKRWFKSAMKAVPKQTITCCKKNVDVLPFAQLFRPAFVKDYQLLMLEHETKNKTYCSNKKCSAFIPPLSIMGVNATCQKCGRQTCARCKNVSHGNKPCKVNREDEKVKDLAEKKGWLQCPGCGNLTAKSGGCLHIKCTMCGTDWCYNCGSKHCDTVRCQMPAELQGHYEHYHH